MRQLHIVGLSADGRQLLLAADAASGKGSHAVVVDDRLHAALRGQLAEPDGAARPTLSVREIQARLRAGATVDEVATAAGVPPARVERFAGPVLSERERVLGVARGAHQTGRGGTSPTTLGAAVTAALAATQHLKPDTVQWSAYRRLDSSWVVRLSLVARGRARCAEWVLDEGAAAVRALDPYAAGLGRGDLPTAAAGRRAGAAARRTGQ